MAGAASETTFRPGGSHEPRSLAVSKEPSPACGGSCRQGWGFQKSLPCSAHGASRVATLSPRRPGRRALGSLAGSSPSGRPGVGGRVKKWGEPVGWRGPGETGVFLLLPGGQRPAAAGVPDVQLGLRDRRQGPRCKAGWLLTPASPSGCFRLHQTARGLADGAPGRSASSGCGLRRGERLRWFPTQLSQQDKQPRAGESGEDHGASSLSPCVERLT